MAAEAFIFARGGSKGLPGKNIKPLAGKPLIAWAIEQALAVNRINRVIVSTDSEEIATVARAFGADVPFIRPAHLAEDESSEWGAWRHALDFLKTTEHSLPEIFVSVPATAPLRLSSDIDAAIDEYQRSYADAVVALTEAHRNPWFNMVKKQTDGTYIPVNSIDGTVARRQDAPPVYDMTTITYVVDPSFILNKPTLFSGKLRAVYVPPERAIDIDTAHDFEVAEFLMKRRLGLQ